MLKECKFILILANHSTTGRFSLEFFYIHSVDNSRCRHNVFITSAQWQFTSTWYVFCSRMSCTISGMTSSSLLINHQTKNSYILAEDAWNILTILEIRFRCNTWRSNIVKTAVQIMQWYFCIFTLIFYHISVLPHVFSRIYSRNIERDALFYSVVGCLLFLYLLTSSVYRNCHFSIYCIVALLSLLRWWISKSIQRLNRRLASDETNVSIK